ncbi:MAG: methylmalonyl-CoA mutase [Ignavibacteriales bacterium]|nr:methylmalonyl-CoA mutase [Ignavibacteriales bacterium]
MLDHFARWRKEVLQPATTRGGQRRKDFKTDSGTEIQPLYIPAERDEELKLGFPGEFPFTRGIYPSMYRQKLWTMRQYAGFGTAEESNKRYRYLREQGTTGLSVAFDLPTQMGYDSDHPLAEGEVGKVGVAIDTLADMEILFDGIKLQDITTSMTINATAAILLCMYVAVAKKQGVDLKRLSGTVQNDILKEYIARGTYIYPAVPAIRLVTDVFEWCARELPRWNAISVSGYHIREAGATAEQELAFTLSNAISYVDAAVRRGLNVDSFGSQISFFFNAHNNFFEEIAKFRAARRIWANIMKERFSATKSETMMLRFHAQTGGATLTAQQIDNNVVRVTIQALAAALGGCQSLHTNSRDEALALPTEDAARLALRTQQIIAYESGIADTPDPLAGSYFLESLTDDIEQRVWRYIAQVDEMGGAVKALEQEFFQREIADSAYRYQKAIESKEKIIVGVNAFEELEERPVEIMRIDESIRLKQIERLNRTKAGRSNESVIKCLKDLENAAKSDKNVVPGILKAVEVYATIGEIADILRNVWGEFKGDASSH